MKKGDLLTLYLGFLIFLGMLLFFAAEVFANCGAPLGSEGQLRYDSSNKGLYFCNGTSWQTVGGTPSFQIVNGPLITAGCAICDLTKTSTATCPVGTKLVTGDCHFDGPTWPYTVVRSATSYACSITVNLLTERKVYSEATCM